MTVSTSGMVVSLEPESRFPMTGHVGHDGRNTHVMTTASWKLSLEDLKTSYIMVMRNNINANLKVSHF